MKKFSKAQMKKRFKKLKKEITMKKLGLCLIAAFTIAAGAYFVAQHAESRAVTAQANCGSSSQCE